VITYKRQATPILDMILNAERDETLVAEVRHMLEKIYNESAPNVEEVDRFMACVRDEYSRSPNTIRFSFDLPREAFRRFENPSEPQPFWEVVTIAHGSFEESKYIKIYHPILKEAAEKFIFENDLRDRTNSMVARPIIRPHYGFSLQKPNPIRLNNWDGSFIGDMLTAQNAYDFGVDGRFGVRAIDTALSI
jgi:hypothetical protein